MRLILALRLLLALSVALVSVQTAVGRAAAAGAMAVELCTEGGGTILLVDAGGQPVPTHFACPDCVLGGMADLVAATGPVRQPQRLAGRLARPRRIGALAARPRPGLRARGPPPAA